MNMYKGFNGRSVLIVIVALAFITGAGWYAWQEQHAGTSGDSHNTRAVTQDKLPTPPLELLATKLPKDWKATKNLEGAVVAVDTKNNCSTSVTYTTDTTASTPAEADSTQALVDGLRAKKNTVVQTAATLTALTSSGQKKVDATKLHVVGPDASEQYFAALTRKDFYAEIHLSCSHEKDLPTAQAALLAIRLNKNL